MGASQSSGITDPWELEAGTLFGFHVLKLKPNSPAEISGLRPYFDIITAVDGLDTFRTIQEFASYIGGHQNQEVTLSVLSLKTQSNRELKMYPRTGWSSNPQDGLLGCSVRFSTVERALASSWHILDVQPGSPAERAGFQPQTDYVIGCEYRDLETEGDFYDLVMENEGKLLSLLVYNSVWDNAREVVLIPKSDWGGEGLLGCGVGFGLLHRISSGLSPDGKSTVEEKKDFLPGQIDTTPSSQLLANPETTVSSQNLTNPIPVQTFSEPAVPEKSIASDSNFITNTEAAQKQEPLSNIPTETELETVEDKSLPTTD